MDPDPVPNLADHFNADPDADPGYQMMRIQADLNADPDPQHCLQGCSTMFQSANKGQMVTYLLGPCSAGASWTAGDSRPSGPVGRIRPVAGPPTLGSFRSPPYLSRRKR